MSSYLIVNPQDNVQIENDVNRLPRYLTKGWRAFTINTAGDVPVFGDEVTLGESRVTARTTTHQVMIGDEVIGEGAVSEAVE